MDSPYGNVANDDEINKTVGALKANNFLVEVVDNKEAAKDLVLKTIPKKSEVFNGASVTLEESGILREINDGDYISLRGAMMKLMSDPTKKREMRQITAAPEYMVLSAHALTQDGKIMVASASGSQIPPVAYGAEHVIFVIGSQKIVKDLDDGLKRIQKYAVPLEDARALKAYGAHTSFNKLFVLNKDMPDRTTIIIIKEKIGY
jgi:hypothetical protein